MLVSRTAAASLIALMALLTGCQHASPQRHATRLDLQARSEAIDHLFSGPSSPDRRLSPSATSEDQPTEADPAAVADTWAESLLVVAAAGPIEPRALDGDLVRVTIPSLVRLDAEAAFNWSDQLASSVDSQSLGETSRLLMRIDGSSTPSAPSIGRPSGTRSPELAMSAVDLPITDDPNRFGLLVVDGDHWGAAVTRHVLDRKTQLDSLLESIDRPRSVRLLGVDRHGRVIHGVSLPLLPMAKSRPDRPQALLSPWWIRDRRTHSNDPIVWRNAAQWLAHDRTLTQAAIELPETVGDLLFLPMLGWQSTIIAPPWAVGGLEIDLSIELPREVADRIDRFEFHLADR